jgi:hypothetical protein
MSAALFATARIVVMTAMTANRTTKGPIM